MGRAIAKLIAVQDKKLLNNHYFHYFCRHANHFKNSQLSLSLLFQRRQRTAAIHVRCADGECKFWLEPIVLASNRGITPSDLQKIEQLVFENKKLLQDKYHEYHSL